MDVGVRIKEIRKAKKITQAELAANAEISRSYLADVEAGRYNPSLETLSKLAQALGIDVSILFKGNQVQAAESDGVFSKTALTSSNNTVPQTYGDTIKTIAAHKTDGYEDGLTEDEKIAVRAFLEAYRKQKQLEKERKGD